MPEDIGAFIFVKTKKIKDIYLHLISYIQVSVEAYGIKWQIVTSFSRRQKKIIVARNKMLSLEAVV